MWSGWTFLLGTETLEWRCVRPGGKGDHWADCDAILLWSRSEASGDSEVDIPVGSLCFFFSFSWCLSIFVHQTTVPIPFLAHCSSMAHLQMTQQPSGTLAKVLNGRLKWLITSIAGGIRWCHLLTTHVFLFFLCTKLVVVLCVVRTKCRQLLGRGTSFNYL